jgi:hypothetical protein
MDQAPELLVIGQFDPDGLEFVGLDVIGGLLSSIDVVDLVIGAMPPGITGIDTSAVGCPTNPELTANTPRAHGAESLQLEFDLGDPGLAGLNE